MENVERIMLEPLKALRAGQEKIILEVKEVKSRVTSLKAGQATVIQLLGNMSGDIAEQHVRYDSLAERVERLEKMLEIID